jgi:hypothetical protein
MFYLGATVHGAELKVHCLKSFQKGALVRIFRKTGQKKVATLALSRFRR